jgi:hypothetical protein
MSFVRKSAHSRVTGSVCGCDCSDSISAGALEMCGVPNSSITQPSQQHLEAASQLSATYFPYASDMDCVGTRTDSTAHLHGGHLSQSLVGLDTFMVETDTSVRLAHCDIHDSDSIGSCGELSSTHVRELLDSGVTHVSSHGGVFNVKSSDRTHITDVRFTPSHLMRV